MSQESYISASEAYLFCRVRELDVTAIETDAIFDALLLRASEMLDSHCRFRGQKLTPQQPRQWPRRDAFDDDGYEIINIPQPIIQAVVKLAILLASDEAEAARALGLSGAIQLEKIGDIEVRYRHEKGQPASLLASLAPYLRTNHMVRINRS